MGMAYSLQQLRNEMKTSKHGPRLGLDRYDAIVGPIGLREVIEDIATTAGSSYLPYGMTRIMTSGSTQTGSDTLQTPIPGLTKKIFQLSSSTGCTVVKASGGALFYGNSVATAGSTVLNFLGKGANVTLFAASTIAWLLMNSRSSLVSTDNQNFSFTTST